MALYEVKRTMMQDKRGLSLQGWLEAGIGIVLVLVLLGIIIVNLNTTYDQNYDPTMGISSDGTKQKFIDYQETVEQGLQGEATTSSAIGINLGTGWGMILAGVNIALDVVTGTWIYNAVALLQLGEAQTIVALMLQILYVTSLGLIILRMILKVNP